MNRINIAVDSGKFETKGMMAVKNYDPSADIVERFRTSVMTTHKDVSMLGVSTVIYEGQKYVIGAPQHDMTDPNSSKDTEDHKICIYTAIANLLRKHPDYIRSKDNIEVNIVIGCPLTIFINKSSREAYLNNMLPLNKKISIIVNNEEFSFTIMKAIVQPECSGVLFLNMQRYRGDIVNLIDIGGLNVNGCQYQNLSPVLSTIFTINEGGNTLISDLRKFLVDIGKEESKLQDNVLELALDKGIYGSMEETRDVIFHLFRATACPAAVFPQVLHRQQRNVPDLPL